MQLRDMKEGRRIRGEKIAKVMEKAVILKDGFHALKEYIRSVDEIQRCIIEKRWFIGWKQAIK